MDADCSPSNSEIAKQILLAGMVQGIGIRPAIVRLAERHSISGFVRNTLDGVELHAEGSRQNLQRFVSLLSNSLPAAARVLSCSEVPVQRMMNSGFRIERETSNGAVSTHVPLDRVICQECLDELINPADRRFHYGLLTCIRCGPRYSITESLPHQRSRTSLADFPLCDQCEREFDDLQDRRCHAETMACPTCGPQIRLLTRAAGTEFSTDSSGYRAIEVAAALIKAGSILLVKGIGGFQFVCDAASSSAVSRIREIKRRLRKPLAVMISRDCISEVTESNSVFAGAVFSESNPIVISEHLKLSESIMRLVSDSSSIGVVLPTTAIHELLIKETAASLVATSGNREGEPLEFHDEGAIAKLGELADGVLLHNRRILRPVDDSVVRVMAGRAVPIRLARGMAPLAIPDLSPIRTRHSHPPVLAVAANQKVAVVVGNGKQVVLGPHLGDMETVAARERFRTEVAALCSLYRCSPQLIACDLHPDFFTTRWAEEQSVEVVKVQHHHAHAVTAMVDHGLINQTVLAVTFDGTGYGPDNTVWGGEFLRATLSGFERFATLRAFALSGGDIAIRQVWRIAGSLLRAAFPEWSTEQASQWLMQKLDCDLPAVADILESSILEHATQTTSMGRLFDGISCLVSGIVTADYEGEPACRLESMSDHTAAGRYSLPIDCDERGIFVCDWRPMIREIVTELQNGVDRRAIAMRFHRTVASCIEEIAILSGQEHVVLTGGCFQNRVLTECAVEMNAGQNFRVYISDRFPPNDGGIAVGQYAIAVHQRFGQSNQGSL